MRMNVFMTQCRIGSMVMYKNKKRYVIDINRNTKEICMNNNHWIRCTEVELLTK